MGRPLHGNTGLYVGGGKTRGMEQISKFDVAWPLENLQKLLGGCPGFLQELLTFASLPMQHPNMLCACF